MGHEHYCFRSGVPGRPGERGERGAVGQDGFSPLVEVVRIHGGHEVRITDAAGLHSFRVMDGGYGDGSLTVRDGEGNEWLIPMGEGGVGDLVITDAEGQAWHFSEGPGGPGDLVLTDDEGNEWFFTRDSGESGGGLPDGGANGDLLVRSGLGARWAAPASAVAAGDDRPVTSAAVHTAIEAALGEIETSLAAI